MAPASTTARMARRAPSFLVIKLAIASTEPLSSMSFPNKAPSRNSGKNCAGNWAPPTMKTWVQCARSELGRCQEVPYSFFGVELGGITELRHDGVANHVNAHACPESALGRSRVSHLAHERNHLELFQRDGIEGHFVDTVEDFARPTGRPRALEGIYRNED